jgi:hypothetical protein
MMAMQSLLVHLEPKQKKALKARAKEKGSSLSAEVRQAIEVHLNGVTAAEMEALDVLSRRAEADLAHMNESLDAVITKLDSTFDEIAHIRNGVK